MAGAPKKDDAASPEGVKQQEPMGPPPKPQTDSTTASPTSSRSGSVPPRRPRSYNKSNRLNSGIFGHAGSHALANNLAAARAPSNAPKGPRPKSFIVPPGQTPPPYNAPKGPRPKSVVLLSGQTPSRVASEMDNLELNGSQNPDWRSRRPSPTYDPSMGPTQSTVTSPQPIPTKPRSQFSNTSRNSRMPFSSKYCKLSGFTRRDFRIGDLISAPFHVANTNPNVNPCDERLTLTVEGPVYSKRRMLVVLFIHAQDLYCLPLFSFGNRALSAKPVWLRDEYVCIANEGDENFVNEGSHKIVWVEARRAVKASTTLQLTGGIRIGCNEDIALVGRLARESYYYLRELWAEIVVEPREYWN